MLGSFGQDVHRFLRGRWDLMGPAATRFCASMRRMEKEVLGFTIGHLDFQRHVLGQVTVALLDMGLQLTLQSVGIDGLALGSVGIGTIGQRAAINEPRFCGNEIIAVMAAEGCFKGQDILSLPLGEIVSSCPHNHLEG